MLASLLSNWRQGSQSFRAGERSGGREARTVRTGERGPRGEARESERLKAGALLRNGQTKTRRARAGFLIGC